MSKEEIPQDDVGIVRLERFLDSIEDQDEAVLEVFQLKFPELLESLHPLPTLYSNEEYRRNAALAELRAGEARPTVVPGLQSNDGKVSCSPVPQSCQCHCGAWCCWVNLSV